MMCCCSYVEGMCHSQQELGGGPTPPHTRYFPTLIFLPPPLSFGRTHAMRKKAAAADYSDIICVNVRNFFLPLPTYRMDTFSALYLFHFPLICQSETSPLTFRASGNIWQQEKKEEEKENKKKTGNVTFFCRVLFFLSLFPQTDALFALLFLNLFFFPPPPPRRFVPKVSAVFQGWGYELIDHVKGSSNSLAEAKKEERGSFQLFSAVSYLHTWGIPRLWEEICLFFA